MKRIITLFGLLLSIFAYSQDNPIVLGTTKTYVYGKGNVGSKIYCLNNKKTDTVTVNDDGDFRIKFDPPLKEKDTIKIWSSYFAGGTINGLLKNRIETNKITYLVQSDADALNSIMNYNSKEKTELEKELDKINELDDENFKLRNTVLTYKARIFNSNFNIPIARFNQVKNDSLKQGDVILFSSIGAGVGYSWGRMQVTRDNAGEIIDEEFSTTGGIHLGFLFSAGTGEDSKNVFAPTINVSLLDFQIGLGYELGTLTPNQKPIFGTISYAIPLHKLVKKAYRLHKRGNLPIESKKRKI